MKQDVIDKIINFARASAVEACSKGLWNGFEGTVFSSEPDEYIQYDAPVREDYAPVLKAFNGKITKPQRELFESEWKNACIQWLYQREDYKKMCSWCGKVFTKDANFIESMCLDCRKHFGIDGDAR